MQTPEFQFISEMLHRRSGLALSNDKGYLIESRLLPIARSYDCATVIDLVALLKTKPNEEILNAVTEAMTTNESLFFRDTKPFDYLRQTVLPVYKAMIGKSNLRIWSAACSTGQEPYSIVMCLLEEAAKMPCWKYDIIATDLASKVIDRAKEGIYSQFEVQRGLPIQMLIKYFSQLPTTSWQIKDNVRNMVTYRLQNLLESYASLGKFDIVFCRNVLIYFDEHTKATVIEQMSKALNSGGYLFLGSTEAIVDQAKNFVPVEQCRGLYRLK